MIGPYQLVFSSNLIFWLIDLLRVYNRDTLLSIAKHYETGETLPEEIYAKLVAAKNFRAGTFSLRQVCKLFSSYSTCYSFLIL